MGEQGVERYMEERNKRCVCGTRMRFLGREQLQLGQTGLLLGHLSNLLAGALEVELWACPGCGKLDFYTPGVGEEAGRGRMAQTICPKCGLKHDLDDPKCPGCGLKNPGW